MYNMSNYTYYIILHGRPVRFGGFAVSPLRRVGVALVYTYIYIYIYIYTHIHIYTHRHATGFACRFPSCRFSQMHRFENDSLAPKWVT